MAAILVVLYVLAAVVCGLMGRRTTFGFIGHFILGLVLTPLGDWLIQVAGRTIAHGGDDGAGEGVEEQ